ncbi:hypothetical protein RHGRI_012346 [Rhododendron griersonianum]|uniref:Uncharacterized protein n=1 Tax=Rhododendron griersonianum TaxID=479676 RepID=A0AAV6KRH6_9ERIC|nr:hypothetical protein RHGRI_012346 [Rhododendron griersonianum]
MKDLNRRTLQSSLGPQKIIKAPGLLSCGPKERLHPLSTLSVGFRLDPGIILSSNDFAACLIIVGSSEQCFWNPEK